MKLLNEITILSGFDDLNHICVNTSSFSDCYELSASSCETGVLACGGRTVSDRGVTSSFFLDASDNTIQNIKPMPEARYRHAVGETLNNRFIVAGGVTINKYGQMKMADNILEYDLQSDRWDVISMLPKQSSQLVTEVVGNKLFVIGGDTGITTEPGNHISPSKCRGDVQILDLDTGEWGSGKPKPHPETGVTSAVFGDEIYVVSSYDDFGSINALVEVYNCSSNSWRRIPDMPTPRTGVPCAFIGGKLFCINGQGRDLKPTSVIEVYDPELNKWDQFFHPNLASAMSQGYAATKNAMFLVGGIG